MVRFIERAALTYICRFVALTLHACYRDSSRVAVPHCDNATVCSGGAFSWIVAKPSVAATSSLLLLLLPEQATLSADNKLILLPLIANIAGVAATCDTTLVLDTLWHHWSMCSTCQALLPFYLLLTWQSPFMTPLLHWLAFFFWACSGCVLLPQDLIFPFQTSVSISTSNALSPNLHHQILYSVDDGFDSTTTIPCNLNPRTLKIA